VVESIIPDNTYTFQIEGQQYWKQHFKAQDKIGMYTEGDEEAPFFSEAFLYNLLGKDNARTVLSIVNRLVEAATGKPWYRIRDEQDDH
jgi:hypothetical protein